jgi:hypothetical protein
MCRRITYQREIMAESSTSTETSAAQGFDLRGLALWLPATLVAAVVLGQLAVMLQPRFSPVLVFPVLLGAALGGIALALGRALNFQSRRWVVSGTLLSALVLTAAQHGFAYLEYRRAFERDVQENPQAQLLKHAGGHVGPAGFPQFIASEARDGRKIGDYRLTGWAVWLSWNVDGLLSVVAAGGVILLTLPSNQTADSKMQNAARKVQNAK